MAAGGRRDSEAYFYLENGTREHMEGIKNKGIFVEPKYYYRQITYTKVLLNPNLEQIFGRD